jgi:hypothetical protein
MMMYTVAMAGDWCSIIWQDVTQEAVYQWLGMDTISV